MPLYGAELSLADSKEIGFKGFCAARRGNGPNEVSADAAGLCLQPHNEAALP